MQVNLRKRIISALFLVSTLAPAILYLTYTPAERWFTLLTLARVGAYTGIMLLLWQYLLGVRFIFARFVGDLIWLSKLHKKLGIFGFLIIVTHPLGLILQSGLAAYIPNFAEEYGIYLFLGQLAFFMVAATWIGSGFFRHKISFRTWKRIHLTNYAILPLALVHALYLNPSVARFPLLHYYLWGIAATFVAIVAIRLLAQLGVLKYQSQIVEKLNVTSDVVELKLAASDSLLKSKPGQFIYVQLTQFGESHPFTIASVDVGRRTISIAPKSLGAFSTLLNHTPAQTPIWIDGPYGIFTYEAPQVEPTVFIAGGIGITPFLRQIRDLAPQGHDLYLFYGCKTEADFAFGPELQLLASKYSNFKLIPIMSEQTDFYGEKGFINWELLQKYLGQNISRARYFICGPAIMMSKLKKALKANSVLPTEIYTEEFAI
jgi:predicted ferric reductase